jgi:hypothetical protein
MAVDEELRALIVAYRKARREYRALDLDRYADVPDYRERGQVLNAAAIAVADHIADH